MAPPEGWGPPSPGWGPPPGGWSQRNAPPGRPAALDAVPNYLGWSILCTLVFFFPAGAVGIVCSVVANRRARSGDFDGAIRASRSAKKACWYSLILGLIGILLLTVGILPRAHL